MILVNRSLNIDLLYRKFFQANKRIRDQKHPYDFRVRNHQMAEIQLFTWLSLRRKKATNKLTQVF